MQEKYHTYFLWWDYTVEKLASIKAGIVGTLIPAGAAIVEQQNWLTWLSIAVAVSTILGHLVKVWATWREDARKQTEHDRRVHGHPLPTEPKPKSPQPPMDDG